MLTSLLPRPVASSLICLAVQLWGSAHIFGQCGPQWLPGEEIPGVNGQVRAIENWDPDGDGPAEARLVAGGVFTLAGGERAYAIAQFEGDRWSAMGSTAVEPYVEIRALLAMPDGDLIAGGIFTAVGGVNANRIAQWDGNAWTPLGSGLDGPVSSLALLADGNIVAGGTFANAGGVPVNNIAQWNGSTWSALGGGIVSGLPQPAQVSALAVHPNGDLIAGGHFTIAGGAPANFIARWDGSNWFPLGSGMSTGNPPDVYALAVASNGDIVAGGGFSNAGGVAANRVARWNGASWSALGAGISIAGQPFTGTVRTLAVLPGGSIVAGGLFDTAGETVALGIASWNGTSWSTLGAGIRSGGNVYAMKLLDDGRLAVGGDLNFAGDTAVSRIAHWNGASWGSFGFGLTDGASAWAVFDDSSGPALYAAGSIAPGGSVAKWDGIEWTGIGGGISGVVDALVIFDDGTGPALYAGGDFTIGGGGQIVDLAKWNGFGWSPVGVLGTGWISSLAVFDDGDGAALYAGGALNIDGAPGIARWDGASWSAVGGGIAGTVSWMAVDENAPQRGLYVSGSFSQAGGVPAVYVARWDGASWSALGSGVNGFGALAVRSNGDVIYGATVAAVGANRIARWDGLSWSPMGSGLNDSTRTLAVLANDDVIVGGNFTTAGGSPASRIARWDGAAWSTLGTGLSGNVRSLFVAPHNELIASGYFDLAGGVISPNWARWVESPVPWVARHPRPQTSAVGGAVTLTAAPANGFSGVSFRWQRYGADINDGPGGASPGGGTVSGAAGTLASPTHRSICALTIENAQIGDTGEYSIVFSNACGDAISNAAYLEVCGCGAADVDCDGSVGLADLSLLLSNFGRSDNPPHSSGNVDGDSDIDLADLSQLLAAFGTTCN